MHPISVTTASNVIGQIYDCALDPALWPAALSALHTSLGFANASMALNALPSGVVALDATVGVAAPYFERMREFGPDVMDLWGGLEQVATLPLNVPAVLSRLRPREAIMANRYYREWAEPQGLDDVVAIGLARDSSMVASLGMGRHRDNGVVTDTDVENVQIFLPHLQRAVAISRIFELKAVELGALHDALEGLAAPAFIVGPGFTLLHVNDTGAKVLSERDPLLVDRGVLRSTQRDTAGTLQAAVAQAVSMLVKEGGQGTGIPLHDRNGDLFALHVVPMSRFSEHRIGQGAVILFLSDPRRSPAPSHRIVADAYRLTASEEQVFRGIAQGATIEELASSLGVARSTVRTHLIHLFNKTGTHRQAELVNLAARLARP